MELCKLDTRNRSHFIFHMSIEPLGASGIHLSHTHSLTLTCKASSLSPLPFRFISIVANAAFEWENSLALFIPFSTFISRWSLRAQHACVSTTTDNDYIFHGRNYDVPRRHHLFSVSCVAVMRVKRFAHHSLISSCSYLMFSLIRIRMCNLQRGST